MPAAVQLGEIGLRFAYARAVHRSQQGRRGQSAPSRTKASTKKAANAKNDRIASIFSFCITHHATKGG